MLRLLCLLDGDQIDRGVMARPLYMPNLITTPETVHHWNGTSRHIRPASSLAMRPFSKPPPHPSSAKPPSTQSHRGPPRIPTTIMTLSPRRRREPVTLARHTRTTLQPHPAVASHQLTERPTGCALSKYRAIRSDDHKPQRTGHLVSTSIREPH